VRPISAWNRVVGKKSTKWSKVEKIDHLLQSDPAGPRAVPAGSLHEYRNRGVDQIVKFLAWPSPSAAARLAVATPRHAGIR